MIDGYFCTIKSCCYLNLNSQLLLKKEAHEGVT